MPKRPRASTPSALRSLLGDASDGFFATTFERRAAASAADLPSLLPWDTLLATLRDCSAAASCTVLVLKDQHPTAPGESTCLASAYLDGCSIIVNHAEAGCAPLAALCEALRADFPHAYCQLYLTPPDARAVDAHADDRDVFVVQLGGAKRWSVCDAPPIVRPGRDEQVGKGELPVPEELLAASAESLTRDDGLLREGAVRYIPRGFVHEAAAPARTGSLHATIALATADWSWASLVEDAGAAAGWGAAAASAKRRELEALPTTLDQQRCWRRCAPPVLVCPPAPRRELLRRFADLDADAGFAELRALVGADEPELAAALELACELAAAAGLRSGVELVRAYAAKADAHNAQQDAARPPAAPAPRELHVRRLREGEEAAPRAEARGLQCREELAPTLLAALAAITTAPVRVSELADGPLFDAFGKRCFAQVCVDQGLLLFCDAGGEPLP